MRGLGAHTRGRLARAFLAAGLLVAFVGPAAGTDLELAVGGRGVYDDNAFGGPRNPESDISFRVVPKAALVDREGDLQWRLRYRPDFEYFVDADEAKGWTHVVDGNATWRLGARTTLQVSERFQRLQNLNRGFETATEPDGTLETTVEFESRRIKRNNVSATLRHRLTASRQLILSASHSLNDFDRESRSDTRGIRLNGQYFQQVTQRSGLGLGLSWRRQTFEASEVRSEDSTNFYNLFGRWSYQVDPVTSLDLSVGPALVDREEAEPPPAFLTEQRRRPVLGTEERARLVDVSSCPTLDDGTRVLTGTCRGTGPFLTGAEFESFDADRVDIPQLGDVPTAEDTSVNFFADATLTRRFEDGLLRLSYRRQETDTGGLGSSAISDNVNATGVWEPSRRWELRLVGLWSRREQSSESVGFVRVIEPTTVTLTCAGAGGTPFVGGLCITPSGLVFRPTTVTGAAEQVGFRAVEQDRSLTITQIVARVDVGYRLTKRIRLLGRAMYLEETFEGALRRSQDFDRFRLILGFDYEFEAIHL